MREQEASESAGSARRSKVTSFDVAARAGVCQSTVSRALSGSPLVSEATRQKVSDAAEALGYFVDERAARLRRGHTGMLAIVIIGRPGEASNRMNPFNFGLLGSICAAAAARQLETLVSFQAQEGEFFGNYVERGQAEGLIVIGTTSNQPAWDYFRSLRDKGAKPAFWGSPFEDVEWVRSDNRVGGQKATAHLISRGYSKIAFLGSTDSPKQQFRERYEGYLSALDEAGRTPLLAETGSSPTREEEGRDAVARLIASGADFDAIFAACDAMALGAMEELERHGISIPGDVGVVGFDGLASGQYAHPPLTTIEPDFVKAGEMLVAAALAGEDDRSARRVPVRLLQRSSVK